MNSHIAQITQICHISFQSCLELAILDFDQIDLNGKWHGSSMEP